MPLYEYRCERCGALDEHRTAVRNRDHYSYCELCPIVLQAESFYSPTKRVLTAPHLHGSPNMPND